jgi:hypothetical protein
MLVEWRTHPSVQISDESVDLICLDPPLNSNCSYNVLFRGHRAAPFWFGSAQG